MTDAAAPTQAQGPNFRILTQFVRDLSFENPADGRAPQGRPDLNVNVNVDVKKLDQENLFRTALKIKATAASENAPLFVVDLEYAGVFEITNADDNLTQQLLLIEAPRQLFPFARRIVADVTRDGGYPPLMLDPIDFIALYRQQMERLAAQEAAKH